APTGVLPTRQAPLAQVLWPWQPRAHSCRARTSNEIEAAVARGSVTAGRGRHPRTARTEPDFARPASACRDLAVHRGLPVACGEPPLPSNGGAPPPEHVGAASALNLDYESLCWASRLTLPR